MQHPIQYPVQYPSHVIPYPCHARTQHPSHFSTKPLQPLSTAHCVSHAKHCTLSQYQKPHSALRHGSTRYHLVPA
eukprot:1729235-Rhodomonas_salina.1